MYQQQQSEDSIQVLIRIKPGCQDEAAVYTDNQVKLDKHSFGFDKVFPPTACQEDIFNAVGKKLIGHALQGYNSCVFVYGQTGSGKTFTMMGNSSGLMQRSFGQLFSKIDRLNGTECIVTCSYFQLYNEQIIDLLDAKKQRKNLNIRQDVRRGMFVQNLTEESALNSEKLVECLNIGMKNRHIGQTMMNRESSRSHSIFTISLSIKQDIDGKKVLKTPKLHFVDLAGSQRQKMTLATGDRLKEAGNINKSLTTLGMVINALATEKNKTHIPYRDSKLTCLLKDSLGGNSKTFIIATVSPSILCFQQSLSTLNFANRAKMVKVKALINQESLSNNIEQYKEQIRKLKQEIMRLKSEKKTTTFQYTNFCDSVVSKTNGDLEHKFEKISDKIQDLKSNLMNSSVGNIIEMLGKISNQKIHEEGQNNQRMQEQNGNNQEENYMQRIQEQGNQLLQYMSSNHQLLKKIHTTLNDYSYLKEQIKNIQITKRMPLQDIRTPSKFERDQYQDLLNKRQNYIKELQQRVVSLKEASFKKEYENKELKRKLSINENTKQSEEERFTNLRNILEEVQRRNADLQLKNQMLNEKNNSNQKLIYQMETRVKQSKQLYIYSEEKYQNERSIRNRLENNIKQLNKKYNKLEMEKREEFETYKSKIEEFQDKIQQFQRKDSQLRNELEIMAQTLEFNSKKMKQYSEKCSKQNKIIQELTQTKLYFGEKNSELTIEIQNIKIQYENTLSQNKIQNNQLKNVNYILQQELTKVKNQLSKIKQAYEVYQKNSKEIMESLQMQLLNNNEILKQTNYQIQIEKSQHKKLLSQYDLKIFQLNKTLTLTKNESEVQKKQKQLLEQKYQKETQDFQQFKEQILNEKDLIEIESNKKGQLLMETQAKLKEVESQVVSTKDIVEDHQQLKKTYKEIIKENYKLKGEYISTSNLNASQSVKNQELVSKVAFYQQKFKLMSIQYNKLQQAARKLKQKEVTLQKKVQFFEEKQKLKKIHDSQASEEIKNENLHALQLQNSELKAELSKLTANVEAKMNIDKKEDYSKKINLDNYRYELEQKQEKIKKKLESAIKNWDHAKENNCAGMGLQQLFECWHKIECESRKKIQEVHKSIKRQAKLKSQNKFIVKQNAYLKQKVESLQKEMNFYAIGNPRKMTKLNEVQQQ